MRDEPIHFEARRVPDALSLGTSLGRWLFGQDEVCVSDARRYLRGVYRDAGALISNSVVAKLLEEFGFAADKPHPAYVPPDAIYRLPKRRKRA